MRKSILIGVLAALMLFAFTACDSQVPNIPNAGDNDIAKVTIASAPTFYAGGSADDVYVTVDVQRVGGKVTEDVPAVVSFVENKVVPGTNPVKISFGSLTGADSSAEYTYMGSVEAESVIELDVEYKAPTAPVSNVSSIEVTSVKGVYADGTKTNVLTYSTDYTFAWNEDKTAAVITLTADKYADEAVTFAIEAEYDEPEPEKATKLVVEYTVNGGTPTGSAGTVYYGDTVDIAVYTAYANSGEDVKLDEVTSQVRALNGQTFNPNYVAGTTAYSATVAYNGLTTPVSVGIGSDYVENVSGITLKNDTATAAKVVANATIGASGTTLTPADFQATATKKSGAALGASDVTISVVGGTQTIPSTATAGSTFPVYMSATYTKRGVQTVQYFWVDLTVSASN